MSSASSGNPTWENFLQDNLLKYNLLSGIVVITQQGIPVYENGDLEDLDQGNWQQFLNVFKYSNTKHDFAVSSRGFEFNIQKKNLKFTVYHKTHCSIYAVSTGKEHGLVVCNLPYGILICNHPNNADSVIPLVENFCASLRA